MKKPLALVPSLVALLLGSVAASMPGCNSRGSSGADEAGGANWAGPSGGNGDGSGGDADSAGGTSASAGGADSSGPAGAGAPGNAGSPGQGDAGASTTGTPDALPTTTFLYVQSVTPDSDRLISLDYLTGDTRVITDLKGDDSDGWEIWGHAISPDRTRIVTASLYGPTKADNATGLATRRIWTMATDGSDMQRLTPVFDNDGAGRKNYSISVQGPVFTNDGQGIIYEFGNWWYEGTSLEGGSFPWFVSTDGTLPEPFPTILSCTVVDPSVNPVTGEVLLVHSVCVNSADEGIFLYPSTGGTKPIQLVARGYGAGAVDPALQKASWLADGSGFIFVGNIDVQRGADTDVTASILLFDMETGQASVLFSPDADTDVRSAAIAPNADGIVYCLAHDNVLDLHAIDLTVDPPEDSVVTDDGISCSPGF